MSKDKIEKARQAVQRNDGDPHPTKPDLVWNSAKNDWRKKKKDGSGNSGASKSKTGDSSDGKDGSKTISDHAAGKSDAILKKVLDDPNADQALKDAAKKELDKRAAKPKSGNDGKSKDVSGDNSSSDKDKDEDHTKDIENTARKELENYKDEDGWYMDKDHPMIKKYFKMNTKSGRIAYDQFVDKMKRSEDGYRPPVKVIQGMNRLYYNFLINDHHRFGISAGGAGIGKTYGFKKLAELENKVFFNPEDHQVGADDYDIFEAPNVKSENQLISILRAHNGKTILFDDTDAILTRKDMSAIMKKATISTGKRIIGDSKDPTKNFEFTGRIMVMTNKSLSGLSEESEDAKAVISRAMLKRELNFTVNEQMEILESRFQDMEFPDAPRLPDADEDRKERDEVFKIIKDNIYRIDPARFTTRNFQEFLVNRRSGAIAAKRIAEEDGAAFTSLLGDNPDEFDDDLNDLFKGEDESSTGQIKKSEDSSRKSVANDDGVFYSEEEAELVKAVDNDEFFSSISMTEEEALDCF